ncbi:hypothetical protein F5X96DRAFT_667980 [Biscogniauxia mediterranea]|nr:hypothetical protein F5X96DRAFT_667980 [Biscogniauxia mediterranea]
MVYLREGPCTFCKDHQIVHVCGVIETTTPGPGRGTVQYVRSCGLVCDLGPSRRTPPPPPPSPAMAVAFRLARHLSLLGEAVFWKGNVVPSFVSRHHEYDENNEMSPDEWTLSYLSYFVHALLDAAFAYYLFLANMSHLV